MTRDDIIRMAHEAQLVRFEGGELEGYQLGQASPDDHSRTYWSVATPEKLEHFAALIEERLSYDGVHTCSDQCQRPACVATREAVQREREACAQICDEHWRFNGSASECAAAIRARGER